MADMGVFFNHGWTQMASSTDYALPWWIESVFICVHLWLKKRSSWLLVLLIDGG